MVNLKSKFGQRVKELRKSKGFTQEKIAEIIGVEPPNISKLEKGTHFPLPENIEKIAAAIGTDVKNLFDFDHFNEQEFLKEKIKNYIDNATPKEIEFFYKLIINLNEFACK